MRCIVWTKNPCNLRYSGLGQHKVPVISDMFRVVLPLGTLQIHWIANCSLSLRWACCKATSGKPTRKIYSDGSQRGGSRTKLARKISGSLGAVFKSGDTSLLTNTRAQYIQFYTIISSVLLLVYEYAYVHACKCRVYVSIFYF